MSGFTVGLSCMLGGLLVFRLHTNLDSTLLDISFSTGVIGFLVGALIVPTFRRSYLNEEEEDALKIDTMAQTKG